MHPTGMQQISKRKPSNHRDRQVHCQKCPLTLHFAHQNV